MRKETPWKHSPWIVGVINSPAKVPLLEARVNMLAPLLATFLAHFEDYHLLNLPWELDKRTSETEGRFISLALKYVTKPWDDPDSLSSEDWSSLDSRLTDTSVNFSVVLVPFFHYKTFVPELYLYEYCLLLNVVIRPSLSKLNQLFSMDYFIENTLPPPPSI